MSHRIRLTWPLLALAALTAIWGYNWVVMKAVLRDVAPFDFVALRTVLGTLALFALLVWQGKPLCPPPIGPTLLLGLLQTAGFMGLTQWALVEGGAGKTAVLAYTMPFWVLLLAWPFLGERLRGRQWLAVALAVGGLLFILEPWALAGTPLSALLAIAGGLAWGAGAVVAKRLRRRGPVDLLSLTAWQMLLGTLVMVVVAWQVPAEPVRVTAYFIGALAYNAVLATALAWLLWLFVLDRLPAGTAGLSTLAVPTVGVLAAWAELGERPSAAEFAGMALIVVALGVLSTAGWRRG